MPQFPHVKTGNNNSPCLTVMLGDEVKTRRVVLPSASASLLFYYMALITLGPNSDALGRQGLGLFLSKVIPGQCQRNALGLKSSLLVFPSSLSYRIPNSL